MTPFHRPSLAKSATFLLSLLCAWPTGPARAAEPQSQPERERQYIAVLQSAAPPADKAMACKRLVVCGTSQAVPALAPLLADPELASWARIALEAIPEPACDEALRAALTKLQGNLLIGVINSLGWRRDAQAVPALLERLQDANPEVAAAAAAALGRIGGPTAAQALTQALATASAALRSEAAEACVRCAERFLAEGNAAQAIKLYDTVRQASLPKQRVLEATRGAILARQSDGLPLLLQTLRSTDKAFYAMGLRVARELPGRAVTEALAADWQRADAERQTLLVQVLADRRDPAALPTIQKAAQAGPKPMRLAALGALERLADPASVPVLLRVATDDDAELAQAAQTALTRLPGKEVQAALLARLAEASGPQRRVLLEVAGRRQITEALPAAVRSAEEADAGVRRAAITTIGIMGDESQAAELARLLERSPGESARADIEKALLAISNRRGTNCLPALLPLARHSDPALRALGMRTLANVGGPVALAAVKAALEDRDETVQDEAVRALSAWAGNWPEEAGVADTLLTLAKSAKKPAHQVLGLRGYLDCVQGDKQLRDEERVARCKELLPLLQRAEEKRLVISTLNALPTAGALEMLLDFAADPAVAEEAHLAVVTLAAKGDLKGASKELRQKALQTVVEKSNAERTRRRAEEALKKLR